MMLLPQYFTVGMLFSGLQASPFFLQTFLQTVLFLFQQTRGHFSKKYDLCPHVQMQTVVWLFMAVLEQLLLPCENQKKSAKTSEKTSTSLVHHWEQFLNT
jgi:hypothetical protein